MVCSLTYATPGDPELPGTVVLKVHQGDKGRHADAAMRALWDTELRRGTVLRIAEPLGYLPDERVLIQGPVPEEQTLKALARKAFASGDADVVDELRHYLDVTADALLALHGCGAVLERSASWTGELGQIRGVLARLAGAVPALPGGAAPLLDRLTDIDRRVATDAMVPAHHDFRPAQVLLEGSRLPRVGFIDFDGASMAEPALDLGRFCAKLRDIAITAWSSAGVPVPADVGADRLALLDDLCRGFVDRYRLRAPVTPDRVLLWECTDLLTALLHAWTKVRIARVTPRLFLLQHRLTTAAAS